MRNDRAPDVAGCIFTEHPMIVTRARFTRTPALMVAAATATTAIADNPAPPSIDLLSTTIELGLATPPDFVLDPDTNDVVSCGSTDARQITSSDDQTTLGFCFESPFSDACPSDVCGTTSVQFGPVVEGPIDAEALIVWSVEGTDLEGFVLDAELTMQCDMPALVAWDNGCLAVDGNIVDCFPGFAVVPAGTLDITLSTDSQLNLTSDVSHVTVTKLNPDCPADTDNDQRVGPNDLFNVLSRFGSFSFTQAGPRFGDVAPHLNPDGQVGIDDLALVLQSFGSDCNPG